MSEEEIFNREQERRIAELEAESSEKDKRIAELETKLRDALGILYEMEAKYVVKDDEAGELDADLDVCKAKLADKEGVFQGFIHRINKMALVHGRLQQSDSGKTSMWMYATYIANQYGFAKKGVDLSVDIRMDMMLNAKEAVPCGWIINELVSNCFEHAFPDGLTTGEPPEVKVEMRVVKGRMLLGFNPDNKLTESDKVELIVSDNGVGLPQDFNPFKAESMGMKIVRSLVEQIYGTIAIRRSSHGVKTRFIIKF